MLEKTNSALDLAKIYTASDIFVNFTYEDTYPTVNLEAQACGIVVASYRTDGSVESVSDDMIVPQGNLAAMKGLILQQFRKKYF